jgi:hypothetical protein
MALSPAMIKRRSRGLNTAWGEAPAQPEVPSPTTAALKVRLNPRVRVAAVLNRDFSASLIYRAYPGATLALRPMLSSDRGFAA